MGAAEANKSSTKRKSTGSSKDSKKDKSSTKRKSIGSSKDSKKDNKKPKFQSQKQQFNSSVEKRQRRHAEIVEEGKRIWNQLRIKTNTPEQSRKLVDELLPLINGKAHEIALQHDASRVVQAAIQFGSVEERRAILKELCGDGKTKLDSKDHNYFVELCKSQYAHFVILKVIKYCHKDEVAVNRIIKSLKGHMPRLAVHAVASRVVESLFLTLQPKETAILKQEFYGPHFALFGSDALQPQKDKKTGPSIPTLESNIKLVPDKKDITLDFFRQLLNKGMDKTLYGFSFFQDLLAEYIDVAPSTEIRIMASSAADNALHLLSGRAGTKVVAALAAYGTPKDRKRILRSLKGYARSGLLHKDAYLAILRIVQLTDDTVSVQKNIFNELLKPPETTLKSALPPSKKEQEDDEKARDVSPLLEIALSTTGSKLFRMLLEEDSGDTWNKIFDPYELSIMSKNPTVKEDGEEVPTSKKDPELRRKELLNHMKEPLIELCVKHSEELIRSISGSVIVRMVYSSFHEGNPELVSAILDVCESSMEESAKKDSGSSIFDDKIGHLAIKHIILVDSASKDLPATSFASEFVTRLKGKLTKIASTNRAAFILAALCKVKSVAKKVKSELQATKIEKLSKAEKHNAGFVALLKELKNKG